MAVKRPLDTQVGGPLLLHTSASEKERSEVRLRLEPLKILEKNKSVTKVSPSLSGTHTHQHF